MNGVAQLPAVRLRLAVLRVVFVLAMILSTQSTATAQTVTPTATVQFASVSYTVDESQKHVKLTITLTGTPTGAVTVKYTTSNGTAVSGTDYTAESGTLTFPEGVTSQPIKIGIIDNGSYTDQTVSFTVTLSDPVNAALGTPSVSTVNILDDDPAPTCEIDIHGVAKAKKQNPGGYVQINANNDNGSVLTYADGAIVPQPGGGKSGNLRYGIPKMRDFDPKNVKLKEADPDLVKATLATKGLNAKGTESVVLSVIPKKDARGKIQLWDTGKKENAVASGMKWTAATLPASVHVEGLLESAELKEITLQLQILNDAKVIATDTCVLTVTPVLTELVATITKGTTPTLDDAAPLGWALFSAGDGGDKFKDQTATISTSAQWDNVRGDLRFIQTASHSNNLKGGNGADLGPRKFDFGGTNAGKPLVDVILKEQVPFYPLDDLKLNGGVATNSMEDSPVLPLSEGEDNVFVNSILPAVGKKTNVDVTDNFIVHATVAFNDKSIYCLGQQTWNVRFAGEVTQPVAKTYKFAPRKENANTGSGPFSPKVRNNANPLATGPDFANGAKLGWY